MWRLVILTCSLFYWWRKWTDNTIILNSYELNGIPWNRHTLRDSFWYELRVCKVKVLAKNKLSNWPVAWKYQLAKLVARHSLNRAGNMWNPCAFTEKGKQADDQRQLVGLQTHGQTGGGREGRTWNEADCIGRRETLVFLGTWARLLECKTKAVWAVFWLVWNWGKWALFAEADG